MERTCYPCKQKRDLIMHLRTFAISRESTSSRNTSVTRCFSIGWKHEAVSILSSLGKSMKMSKYFFLSQETNSVHTPISQDNITSHWNHGCRNGCSVHGSASKKVPHNSRNKLRTHTPISQENITSHWNHGRGDVASPHLCWWETLICNISLGPNYNRA